MIKNEAEILQAVEKDPWMMDILRTAEKLNLPQWIIGAGFIRNFVWDIQHSRTPSHQNNDIDLIYFNPEQADWQFDQGYEKKLHVLKPDVNWEVTNQVHIHTYNDVSNPPYTSAEDGLAHWTETATCTGITIEDGKLKLIAPWGIEDLVQLKLRIPPCHTGKAIYEELFHNRIAKKNWLTTWPLLKVAE